MRILSSLGECENQFQVKRPKKRFRRTPIRRAGKKTQEWDRIRAELKKRFLKCGITRCEIGLPGCAGDYALGFLHYDKRRFLTPEELWIVVLGCNHPCHDTLELLPRAEMKKRILAIISARLIQP